jgi:hypothetical protein
MADSYAARLLILTRPTRAASVGQASSSECRAGMSVR